MWNYLSIILPLFNTMLFIGFGIGGIMAYRNAHEMRNELAEEVIGDQ